MSQPSFWGWGHEDRLPDEDDLREYATFLEDELDFPERPVIDPPRSMRWRCRIRG